VSSPPREHVLVNVGCGVPEHKTALEL